MGIILGRTREEWMTNEELKERVKIWFSFYPINDDRDALEEVMGILSTAGEQSPDSDPGISCDKCGKSLERVDFHLVCRHIGCVNYNSSVAKIIPNWLDDSKIVVDVQFLCDDLILKIVEICEEPELAVWKIAKVRELLTQKRGVKE